MNRSLVSKYNQLSANAWLSLCIALAAVPLVSVVLASICFVLGLSVSFWQGLLPILIGGWMLYRLTGIRKIVVLYLLVIVISIIISGVFIFCDSYDATICHRPAVVLLAKGWNPVWQSTIPAMQEKLGWDFTGVSLKHIVYQPKAVWIYGAIMYRLTGIATGELGLFVLLFIVLYITTWRLASHCWPVSKHWQRHLLCITILAMPKMTQAMSGQVDNVIYAMTLIMSFSFFLFVRTHIRGYLFLALIGAIWLTTTKISGIPIAFMILAVMTVWYLHDTVKEKRIAKLKIIVLLTMPFIGLVLLINASPYITNSVNYGSPFYPAHSFVRKHQMKNADLTNDFVGNEDAEQMGYVGRIAFAYFSKGLTIRYYAFKLGKPDFNPVFKVSEGCEGFKEIFRLAMIVGCICWLLSRRTAVDILIVSIFLSAIFLPTKYIGYARYATQIWIVPFLMIFNSVYSLRWKIHRKIVSRAAITLATAFQFVYPVLVLGRQSLVTLYLLHHSEMCMEDLNRLQDGVKIHMVTSNPSIQWNDVDSRLLFSHGGPGLPYAAIINELSGKSENALVFQNTASFVTLPLANDECLFLIQHGRFLFRGDKQEYHDLTAVREPTSPSAAKTVPYWEMFTRLPKYLLWNLSIRVKVFSKILSSDSAFVGKLS